MKNMEQRGATNQINYYVQSNIQYVSECSSELKGTLKPVNTDSVTLLIYDRHGTVGTTLGKKGYDLMLNDSIICNIHRDHQVTIKLAKGGNYILSASNNNMLTAVPVSLKNGYTYYVRCAFYPNSYAKPKIQTVVKQFGEPEYSHSVERKRRKYQKKLKRNKPFQ